MLKVYLVQMESQNGNRSANLQKAQKLVHEAAPEKGGLIIFPEMFDTGYIPEKADEFKESYDENSLGITAQFLAKLSNETGCTVFGGGIRQSSAGITNHTGIFVPGKTAEIDGYDKIHPFIPEQKSFTAGQKITLFKTKEFNIAPTICYDLRFPELYRDAWKLGINLFTIQAAWPTVRKSHWETLLKARAIENQAFVVAVNTVTQDGRYTGDSQVIDPWGEVIAKATPKKECIVQVSLHKELITECRNTLFSRDSNHTN